jgi:hypothetical protein
MVAACSQPDLLSLTNGGQSGKAGLQPLTGPGQPGSQAQSPSSGPAAAKGDGQEAVLSMLRNVLHHYQFHREPLFAGLKLVDPEAESLLHATHLGNRVLEPCDQVWLNRHLFEAAYRQATGRPCFRRLNSALDGILISDVGKRIAVQGQRRAGGVIRTALRSTDIIWDRVWQLETDTFHDTPGFVFAPITAVVEPAEDPTALHPVIQRQMPNIRTDFDRFSTLEISSLVQHGYCVGRKACRARPDLFGDELPAGAPWDPTSRPRPTSSAGAAAMPGHGPRAEPVTAAVEARTLQKSAVRRTWSTLLDRRDWTSYVYVPLLIPILVLTPLFVIKSHERSQRVHHLVESFSQGTRELGQLTQLLENRPEPWIGEPAKEASGFDEADLRGFAILQDARIFDLRRWKPAGSEESDASSLAFCYRRLKVFKQPENAGNHVFQVDLLASSPKTAVRFPIQQLQPELAVVRPQGSDPKDYHWLARYDFRHVPAGEFVDLVVEHHSPGRYLERGAKGTGLVFPVRAETTELIIWILMPEGREYQSFRIVRYETGKPETVEPVKVVTEYLAEDLTIIAFKLLSLKSGYSYEVSWTYR